MLTYPDIDPVALAFGPFEVHWYGLMYLVAFVAGWWLGVIRTRREGTAWQRREIGDLVFYFALGAVLGRAALSAVANTAIRRGLAGCFILYGLALGATAWPRGA